MEGRNELWRYELLDHLPLKPNFSEAHRSKRDFDACPVHPKPLPQEFINRVVMPDSIKKELNDVEQATIRTMKNQSISALSVGSAKQFW